MKNICIFGLGYIGLPTAVLLANSNHKVLGIDVKKIIVENINKGISHFQEKDLDSLLKKAFDNSMLEASYLPQEADVFIITVPTPLKNEGFINPQPNVDYVLEAAKLLSSKVKKGNLVIVESTSPVGTTEKVAELILKESNLDPEEIHFAYCPERVLPGNIIYELVHNNRVVGGLTPKASKLAKELYLSFCEGNIQVTDARTAELVKLTENSYRDVNIAFANEISMVCDEFSINVRELIDISNNHSRVNILNPGCGVGGHCIAVDPWFIVSSAPKNSSLIKTARLVNDKKKTWVINKINKEINKFKLKKNYQPLIGLLGITFKPNVDDLRESPAFEIVMNLKNSGHELLVCEPNLKYHENIKLIPLDKVISKADIIISLVAHDEFKTSTILQNDSRVIDFSYSLKT